MPMFLDTERLVLRPFTDADADDLFALHDDPGVMRFINGGRPANPAEVRGRELPRLMRRHPGFGHGYLAAEGRGGGGFLGWFEFRPLGAAAPDAVELGYRLNRAAWGRGYATEGARALIRVGFTELGTERVTANTMAVNVRSRRVMAKAGLTFLRAYRGDWPEAIEGSEHGEVEYVLTRAAWERRRARPSPGSGG
ncbi:MULTISPECIES: GNAT family N-acetyltransferase [unclassified Streptomyces]|uniref:GNAT family N-acetyltransferase n=1 Tax=unclassified Streptomyces TaxID=2593676 RepID=UPI0022B70C3A|nr:MULTISPECIES: GNAT family N-acetyltransferase [unclassified Streptomyces]MCZ7413205.1 GNAT family N-acetyltransferase [Streptomyces sp. WMMC897]MCZ7430198.1 GNAT family N-acetyltransferase [Streptomyces sp. WMMC1477]